MTDKRDEKEREHGLEQDGAADTWRIKTDVGIQTMISHISEVITESFSDLEEGAYVFSREKTLPYDNRLTLERQLHTQSLRGGPKDEPAATPPAAQVLVKPALRRVEDSEPVSLMRRWLEQLQGANFAQPVWVRFPAHNQLCFELLLYQGRLVFAPSRERRLFLDFQFRRQAPELTRKMRDMFMTRQTEPNLSCLFEWRQIEPVSKQEHRAMAEQLWRLIQQSATLYGARHGELEFIPAPEVQLKSPVSFSLEELLPSAPEIAAGALLVEAYDRFSETSDQCWLFSRAPQLGWEHIIKRPDRLNFAQIHAIMELCCELDSAVTRWDTSPRFAVGIVDGQLFGLAYSAEHVLVSQAPLVRLGRLVSLLQDLQDELGSR